MRFNTHIFRRVKQIAGGWRRLRTAGRSSMQHVAPDSYPRQTDQGAPLVSGLKTSQWQIRDSLYWFDE